MSSLFGHAVAGVAQFRPAAVERNRLVAGVRGGLASGVVNLAGCRAEANHGVSQVVADAEGAVLAPCRR